MARTASVKITGNVTEALAALDALGIKAEETAVKTEGAFEKSAGKVGGLFSKLGAAMGNFGLPFSESVSKMGEKMADAESKSGKFSSVLADVGKVATGVGIAGFAVAAGEGVKLAMSYQQSTAMLQGSAGISAAAAKQIGDAFLNTGFKTTFSAQEQMSAYASVAAQLATVQGHALSTAQAQQVMAAASDLAEASGTDLATATSGLASVMQAYHLSTSQAADASDVLYNASKTLNLPIDQVSQGMDKLKGRLGNLAPSMTDTGALLVELGEHGITGTRGVGVMQTAMSTLMGGSKKTGDELKALGVHLTDSAGHFVGMGSVIAQLQPKLAGMTDAQQTLALTTLFGSSSAQLMQQVIAGGPAAFDAATAAVSNHGAAQKAAELASSSLKGETEKLKSGMEDLATKLGEVMIPVITKVIAAVSSIVTWFEKHKAVAEVLAGVIGGVLTTAVAAFAVSLFTADGALAFLISPITLIIGAVVALGVGIYELATHWSQVWGDIKQWTSDAWHFIERIFDDAKNFIVGHARLIEGALIVMLGPIGLLIAGVLELATHWKKDLADIKQWTSDAINAVVGFFTALPGRIVGALGDIVSTIWGAMKQSAHWIDTNVLQPVVAFFVALPGRFVTALGDIVTTVWQALKKSGQWLDDNVFKPVVNYFVNLPGRFVNGMGNIVSTVWHALLASGQWIDANVLVPVVGYFTRLPARFVAGLGDIVGTVWHALLASGQWIDTNVLQPVVNYFENLPGRLIAALGDIDNMLVNVGERIIGGLIHGFENMFSSVKNTLGNLTHDLVSWKGPPEVDDVLLTDNGQRIIKGLVKGFDIEIPTVRSTLTGLTGEIASTVAPSTFARVGPAVPQPLTVPVETDHSREVVNAIKSLEAAFNAKLQRLTEEVHAIAPAVKEGQLQTLARMQRQNLRTA